MTEIQPLHSCYSMQLKADLVARGTFVLVLSRGTTTTNVDGADTVVERIVKAVGGRPLVSVHINIFKKKSEVLLAATKGGARWQLCPTTRNC